MSKRPQAVVVYWTQPLDPMEEDLLQVNGRLLPPVEGGRRRKIVDRITLAAERGRRATVGDGAWVARHKGVVVSQVPTSTATDQPGAAIVTCLRLPDGSAQPQIDELVVGLTEFGHRLGYKVDGELARRTMEELIRDNRPWPFRALRRLWAAFRGLFRK